MSNLNVLGFGGVLLAYDGNTATFNYSFGQVKYVPEYTEIKNANKKIYRRFDGYRAEVSCKLYSVDDDQYEQLQNLITIINQSNANNSGITIYPEYSSEQRQNLELTGMFLDSDVGLETLVKREGLQAITLEFESQELTNEIPSWVNLDSVLTRVTSDGDTRVTSDGDTRII